MLVYDPIAVTNYLYRAADAVFDGVWHLLPVEREDIVEKAVEYLDTASELLENVLPTAYHRYVGDEDIAMTAVALAAEDLFSASEVVEDVIDAIKKEARAWYKLERSRDG